MITNEKQLTTRLAKNFYSIIKKGLDFYNVDEMKVDLFEAKERGKITVDEYNFLMLEIQAQESESKIESKAKDLM